MRAILAVEIGRQVFHNHPQETGTIANAFAFVCRICDKGVCRYCHDTSDGQLHTERPRNKVNDQLKFF